MNNNIQDRRQKTGSNAKEQGFGKVPQPTLRDYVIHYTLSYWKAILFLLVIVISLWLGLSAKVPFGVSSEEQAVTASPTAIDNILIEGIYYGEYTDVENCEPFPAKVTKSSNGVNHYLLSSQGQVYEFWHNKENGLLTSSTLGSGTIEIDTLSNEIIIKFKGWILKR